AITLPVVLLILDFYPLDRLPSRLGIAGTNRVLREKLPFFALTVLVAVITVWTNQEGGAIKKAPFFTRILVSAWGYIFYIYKTIIPIDLAPFYPYPSNVSFLSVEYSGAFIAVCAITVASVLLVKKTRLYSAAWFYYAITLVPVIGIVPIGGFAAANRYTYLPILGLLIPVGLAAGSAFERYPKRHVRALIVGAVLIASAAYTASTVMQTPVWKDTITLWSYQMELFPGRVPIAYNNRGLAYAKLGDYRQAIEDYTVATRLDPKAARPFNNRGNAYISLKDYKHAVEDFTIAIKNNPRLTQAYNNRGNAYASLGEFEKALVDYKVVLKLDPRNGMAYYNLALTYAKLGNKEEAVVNFKMAAAMGFRQAQEYLRKKAGAAAAPRPGMRRP
ncbi:MAG: tetratricopeptide repeat protein, partial [Deltaproteobacteria bacterium]|nr:tetratricopeptide repeat protein [Deltaproteobacteria bacterium]